MTDEERTYHGESEDDVRDDVLNESEAPLSEDRPVPDEVPAAEHVQIDPVTDSDTTYYDYDDIDLDAGFSDGEDPEVEDAAALSGRDKSFPEEELDDEEDTIPFETIPDETEETENEDLTESDEAPVDEAGAEEDAEEPDYADAPSDEDGETPDDDGEFSEGEASSEDSEKDEATLDDEEIDPEKLLRKRRPRHQDEAEQTQAAPEDDEEPELTEEEELPPPMSFKGIFRRMQNYADRMYESGFQDDDSDDEDVEEGDRVLRFRQRAAPEPIEEQPPKVLERQFAMGISSLNSRSWLVLLLAVLLCIPLLLNRFVPSIDGSLSAAAPIGMIIQLILGFLAILAGRDVIGQGLRKIFRLTIGIDTLLAITCILSLLDGISVLAGLDRGNMPCFCVVPTAGLFCAMRGILKDKQARRLTCRCAAAAKEVDIVSADPTMWNARPAFRRHPGTLKGFTAQMMAPDASTLVFDRMAPLLLLAAFLLALIASLGRGVPEYFLWDFTVLLASCTSFSGLLCFALPYRNLTQRLAPLGAAVAGWPGAMCTRGVSSAVLVDDDLFPPSTVSMNGIKIFGDFPINQVISYTASVIRATGSNLDKCFYDLISSQGYLYRRVDYLEYVGEGGVEAVVRNQKLLVGSAAFMERMGILLPQGLRVHGAVFVAFDNELAGIFALSYGVTSSVRSSLHALVHSRVRPLLATLNLTLTPTRIARIFNISAHRLDYPTIQRRLELEGEDDTHDNVILAVLCRTGLAPYAAAILGAGRLRVTTLLSTFLALAGSLIGLFFTFYMACAHAYQSMCPGNVLVFLLLWLIPTIFISRWVNRI